MDSPPETQESSPSLSPESGNGTLNTNVNGNGNGNPEQISGKTKGQRTDKKSTKQPSSSSPIRQHSLSKLGCTSPTGGDLSPVNEVDHGKRQHELQHNFKVKITNRSSHKPMKLDPQQLQDRISILENAEAEEKMRMYEQASVSELKEILRSRGLPATGRKPALLERLMTPSTKQRITPLNLSENQSHPLNSPKIKGTSNLSPRYSPYGSGSSSPRVQDSQSPRLSLTTLSINSPRHNLPQSCDTPEGLPQQELQPETDFVITPLTRYSQQNFKAPKPEPLRGFENVTLSPQSYHSLPPQAYSPNQYSQEIQFSSMAFIDQHSHFEYHTRGGQDLYLIDQEQEFAYPLQDCGNNVQLPSHQYQRFVDRRLAPELFQQMEGELDDGREYIFKKENVDLRLPSHMPDVDGLNPASELTTFPPLPFQYGLAEDLR